MYVIPRGMFVSRCVSQMAECCRPPPEARSQIVSDLDPASWLTTVCLRTPDLPVTLRRYKHESARMLSYCAQPSPQTEGIVNREVVQEDALRVAY